MQQDQLLEVVRSKPILAALCILLIVISLLNFVVTDGEAILGLVPVYTLISEKRVWNLITSSFFETNIVKILLEIAAFAIVTRHTEFYDLEQFAFYFGSSLLACSIGTSAYCFIRFFATSMEQMLLEPVYGFGGVFMIMLMYTKQQKKMEPIIQTIPQVTYQNLPVIVVCVQILFWLLGVKMMALDTPFSIIALFFCWSYLRFYYKFDDNATSSGDRSEDFAFVAMFPSAIYPIVLPLSTAFYNIVALTGLYPELPQEEKRLPDHLRRHDPSPGSMSIQQSGSNPNFSSPAPAKQDLIQERRRQKAIKLLDAKMAELSNQNDGWEDCQEDIQMEEGKRINASGQVESVDVDAGSPTKRA